MEYIGEHLLPGQIGHFLIVLSFVSAFLAAIAYFFAAKNPNDLGWKKMGRTAFVTHGLSVIGIIGIVFYIMIQQYYEYIYVFDHVSDDLHISYIFAAFWEGQEGSFLLWMFWHVILGFVLLFTARSWEAPVMSVFAMAELFIASMLLGLYFYVGGYELKIGVNPLLLFRDVHNLPIFNRPDYLQLISGSGLNPLLQNYWMTIHPPILFLGFASTIVPFSYAIAGLFSGRHREWLRPVLPWALFSGVFLGVGILMGGAWAYEALSFGGYWAWDPVENTSLVPWLIMVAAIHCILVAKSTDYSIRSAYAFSILSFVMVIYSTTLTRSGVLGDSSVHAFTNMGLGWQLVAFNAFFVVLGLFLLFKNYTKIPAPEREESIYSREFWIFIGALILLFSSILITHTTSIPVYSKLGDWIYQNTNFSFLENAKNWSPPEKIIAHHNGFQLWIGLFIGLLSGFVIFLRYKTEKMGAKQFKKIATHIGFSALLAAVATVIMAQWINILAWQYAALTWTSWFVFFSNADYLITVLRFKLKLAGAALSHLGFGIMILGSLASGLNKEIISKNNFMSPISESGDRQASGNNVLLYKNLPTDMSDYTLTYSGDSIDGRNRYFNIDYIRKDEEGAIKESFRLTPNVLYDKQGTKVEASNPSTKHYLHRDIFTHIAALPLSETDPKEAKNVEDSLDYATYTAIEGDTFYTKKHYVVFEGADYKPQNNGYRPKEGDIATGFRFRVQRLDTNKVQYATPVYLLSEGKEFSISSAISDWQMKFRLPENFYSKTFEIEKDLQYKEFTIKEGDTFEIGNNTIRFDKYIRSPKHHNYHQKEGDIAVGAHLVVVNNPESIAEPVYFIRDNTVYNIKDEMKNLGLHFKFLSVKPKSETITISVAVSEPYKNTVIVEIAENMLRKDWVVLEAIAFPGINLFWAGSIIMLFGVMVAFFSRLKRYKD